MTTQGAGAGPPSDATELERDIELTRERLGETVEALAAKTDVKARARDKVGEVTGQVRAKGDQLRAKGSARAGALSERLKNSDLKSTGIAGAQRAIATVRERPVPAAATAAVVMAFLIAAWSRRRGRG
jgi:hypothetical protein